MVTTSSPSARSRCCCSDAGTWDRDFRATDEEGFFMGIAERWGNAPVGCMQKSEKSNGNFIARFPQVATYRSVERIAKLFKSPCPGAGSVTHFVYHDEIKYPLKRKIGRNPLDQSPIPSFHSIFTRNHSIIRRSLLKIRTYLHTTCLN